jgi:A/G-specific adenine glycosylase
LHRNKLFFGESKRAGDYAQAIMEIGALICKPSIPLCNDCPLTKNCKAFNRKDFLIKSKNKFNKTKYFEANIYMYKNKYLLIKNKKFNFLKNLVIFPMTEINQKTFKYSVHKKINVKMSNMNMKIIINRKNKIKRKRDSLFLDKTNINKYILPSFTKKIFYSVSH